VPDGSHTFEVRAVDTAGNADASPASYTWTIDTTAPNTSLTSTPPANDPSNDPSFSFSASEAATFECRLDGGSWATCTSPKSYVDLLDGSHTFDVRAIDTAGNVDATPASYTWSIDTSAPTTTIDSAPPGDDPSNDPSFTFSSNESGTFECRLDGGAWATCISPKSYVDVPDGSHTFEVRAVDTAGNVDATPASYTWTIDTTTPNTSLTSTPPADDSSNDPSFSFSASEAATFECRLDGSSWAACTSPKSYVDLLDGSHTFDVRAIDAAGNVDASPASYTWTIDTATPDTSLTSTPPGDDSSNDPSFSFSASEAATFECRLDGSSWAACTSPKSYVDVPDGSHTFDVRAADSAGNVDASPASYTWTIDTATPDTSLTSTPPVDDSSNDPSFSFSSNEPGTFECRLDGGAWAVCTSPKSYVDLLDGTHTFEVRAIDTASNVDATPAAFTWTIDTAAPAAPSIATPADGTTTNDTTPTVTGTAEANAAVTIYDGAGAIGATAADGSGNWSFTPGASLAEGAHDFTVRATDVAGNTSVQSNQVTVTIDTSAPTTTVDSAPPGNDPSNDPSFTFSSNEPGTFECRLDGGSWATCTSPQSYTDVPDGSHTFEVRAIDTAGNTDATPASYTWTIDTATPDTSLTSTPPANDASNDPSFSFSASEAATFECRLDGGSWSACATPKSYTDVPDGSHTFDVRAIDTAGNTDATPATYTWTIDTAAPAAPVITSPADPHVTTDTTPTFTGTADASTLVTIYDGTNAIGTTTVDGSGNWSYTPGSAMSDGAHVVTAKSSDGVGNASAASNTVNVTIDTTAPNTTLSVTPPANDPSNDPSFTFSSNEPGTFECRLDGGSWAVCASPQSYTDLPDGPHTFEVRAIDALGNTDSTPATRSWTIDTAAPVPPVISSPTNGSSSSDDTPLVQGTSEPGASVTVYVDGALIGTVTADGSGNWSITISPALSAGTHTFEAKAADAAGNVSGSSSIVSYMVSAPVTTPPAEPPSTTPPSTTPPTTTPPADQCTPDEGEAAIPPKIKVTGVTVSRKTLVKFNVTSDQFAIARVTIKQGSKKMGTAVRAINAGSRQVVVKVKKLGAKNVSYSARLSAVSMSGGKAVADALLAIDAAGKPSVGPLTGNGGTSGDIGSVVECGKEPGAPSVKVKLATVGKVKVGVKSMTVKATANQFAVSTVKVIQNGKTLTRKVFILKPGKTATKKLAFLGSSALAKGKYTVQASTFSVDGVRVTAKKTLTAK
ncbi:MAG: hypothetical protein HY827_07550, partial [Actinobacteria bacterium]|nr:hypothetical protein [Actinomycetota bacterium]